MVRKSSRLRASSGRITKLGKKRASVDVSEDKVNAIGELTADDATTTFGPSTVLLVPADTPFAPVLVDRALLMSWDIRTSCVVRHDPPTALFGSTPAWTTYMSRSMVLALVRGMRFGEFALPSDVEYVEAMRTFEYEGVHVPGTRLAAGPKMRRAPDGLGSGGPVQAAQRRDDMLKVTARIADAVALWPRLQAGMKAALNGDEPPFTCTSTRAWLTFSQKPVHTLCGTEQVHGLAKRRPSWLFQTLQAFGALHHDTSSIDKEARDENAFIQLADAVEASATFHFISVIRDYAREQRASQPDKLRHATSWAQAVLLIAGDYGVPAHGADLPVPVRYARSCVALAERLVRETPCTSRLFGARCADEDGATPERVAFEAALRRRDIRIVRWTDDVPVLVDPLTFPPAFGDSSSPRKVCVLIEVSHKQR